MAVLRRHPVGVGVERRSAVLAAGVVGVGRALRVVPGVVVDVQAVGDQQLRQARGVGVVALGAGEVVVERLRGAGVDRMRPSCTTGRQWRSGTRGDNRRPRRRCRGSRTHGPIDRPAPWPYLLVAALPVALAGVMRPWVKSKMFAPPVPVEPMTELA